MSQWKPPKIRTYAPTQIDSAHSIEQPTAFPHRQGGDEQLQSLSNPEMPAIYSEAPSTGDTMQLAASSGGKRGVWRKSPAEIDWRPSPKISPDQVAEMLRTYIDVLQSGSDSLCYTDMIALIRLAREHLVKDGPHVVETFEAAVFLLNESIRTKHLGNRHLAGKLMIHTNPLLPDAFQPAYAAAETLRRVIIEQEDDATTHIQAYMGLIHCFSADQVEVTEGLAIFEGLATMGKTKIIREEARTAYWEIVEVRSPKLHRRPNSKPKIQPQ